MLISKPLTIFKPLIANILCLSICLIASPYHNKHNIEAQTKPNSKNMTKNFRLAQLRKDLIKDATITDEMYLLYSRKKDNNLIFYDLAGHEVYLRYRQDKFDFFYQPKLPHLSKGQSYYVRGSLIGLIRKDIFISIENMKEESSQFNKELQKQGSILVLKFISARLCFIDDLI